MIEPAAVVLPEGPADGGLDALGEEAWSSLDTLARSLAVPEARLKPTLDAIVAAATTVIAGVDHAGLILLVDGRLVPQATEGKPPEVLDAWQQQTGFGPCIAAAATRSTILVSDTAAETRWGVFGTYARSLGVASMLCMPLLGPDRLLGALSFYSGVTDGFLDSHRPLAQLCATHAALALSDAFRTEQLHAALENRDVIGQGKGIVMERYRVTAAVAFDVLSRASQAANLKLPVVARRLVETGELPGVAAAGAAIPLS